MVAPAPAGCQVVPRIWFLGWLNAGHVRYDADMAHVDESKTFRGVVKGGGVVFEQGVRLPDGTPVLVTVESGARGTPQAVLAAMAGPPGVTAEDVAELLQEIERGKRPVQFGSPLD